MKKLLAFAAAIAVIGGLAFAMLADRQVLSFSEPKPNAKTSNVVPPNQSQPQDFDGAGSQFYYFGPDFMCQVFVNTTVRCYGSDAHGVVSDTPSGTGFTNVDGGDTYACAFHQATRFNQCWGSITLSPTTIQPTATPDPTATPEPTATPLPPGVTPEPTATAEPTPIATDPCLIRLSESAQGGFSFPVTRNEEWVAECVYILDDLTLLLDNNFIPKGPRYYKSAAFELVNSASLVATIESAEDTVMLLWEFDRDEDGNIIDDSFRLVDANDDLELNNTNSRINWNAVAGKYYLLDLTTYELNTLGDFTLRIEETAGSSTQSLEGATDIYDVTIPSGLRQR